MTFLPLDGSAAQGKIATLADRNGVALTCAYGSSGELVSVSSQFGQSLSCTYGSDGRLATVADQTGRFVQYSYYGPGQPGGNDGDLASISCAQIPGQTPIASPCTFTYSTGNLDDLLNHNLLTVSDGAGRVLEQYQYSTQTDPTKSDYDLDGSIQGLRSEAMAMRAREDTSLQRYTVLENDPLGRLTECDYDTSHRCVARREYTGFCTPGVVVTSTTNRPTGKLRASDPDYFETTWEYDAQNLCTRETLPDGTQLRHSYECDLHPGGPVREGGNERVKFALERRSDSITTSASESGISAKPVHGV
jgi:YD repeat-containing protein